MTVTYTKIEINPDSTKTETDFVKQAAKLGFTLVKCEPVDLDSLPHAEAMKKISDNRENQNSLKTIAHMIDPDVIDYAGVYSL